MHIVIATDLHGVTEALRAACDQVLAGHSLHFLSPWASETNPYADEHSAHQAFVQGHGFAQYHAKIAQTVQALDGAPVALVGFSVGATAGWLYAGDRAVRADMPCWLFYGSRIRDYADQPVHVAHMRTIWAEHEASFDSLALSQTLVARGISAEIVAGTSHGFMNPHSTHYRAELLAQYLASIPSYGALL